MNEQPKIIFEDDSKTLTFENLQPIVIFANEAEILRFDIVTGNNGFTYTFPFFLS